MMGNGGENHANTARRNGGRGASPIVGIVLLFGMVALGAVLLFAAGTTLVETLESESAREKAHMCMDEADHRLATVAKTGQRQSMPDSVNSNCQTNVIKDGQIDIVWYDNSTEDPDDLWDDENRTASASLGALEFELDDRTIAHQGGGIWEYTSEQTVVVSDPGISYTDDSIQFGIMQLDEDELDGSEPIARADPDKSAKLAAEIDAAASNSNGTDVALRIESSYADGWRQYLETEFGSNADIDTPQSGVVTATIENIRDPADPAKFVVVGDRGLRDASGDPLDQRVDDNTLFRIGGVIENIGEQPETQNVTVSIWDSKQNTRHLTKPETISLNPGESTDLSRTRGGGDAIHFEPGLVNSRLTKGETYTYTVETEDDDLVSPGTFYYGESNPYFEITSASPSSGTSIASGNVTISADVQQIGISNTSDQSVELTLKHLPESYEYDAAPEIDVNGTYGASTPVEWQMNTSRMLQGKHQYTIDSGDESVSGTFIVESGVDPGETELYLESGNRVNVSILGTEVSAESPTGEQRNKLEGGEKTDGNWSVDAGSGWTYDWDQPGYGASEPDWNDEGGWQTNGSLECISTDWLGSCQEYDFTNAEKFWWDENGGWELEWTESQHGDWSWDGASDWTSYDVYDKQWAPVTVDIITQPVDEDGTPTGDRKVIEPDNWGTDATSGGGSPESRNLNTHDTRDEIWEYSFMTEDRVSLTLSSTLHSCHNYQLEDTDMYTDGEYYDYHDTWSEYDGNGIWDHYDCTNIHGESLNVDATTDSNNANVRVRDSEDNTVPELRAGHQRQHSADEVLERVDRDLFGGELEDGTGYLDLEEGREFVFMFEVTQEAPDGTNPDEYWEQAKETDSPGDPNFNDVIVLVEVDGVPTDLGTPTATNGDSDLVDTSPGKASDDADRGGGGYTETGVEVNTDHIVIG